MQNKQLVLVCPGFSWAQHWTLPALANSSVPDKLRWPATNLKLKQEAREDNNVRLHHTEWYTQMTPCPPPSSGSSPDFCTWQVQPLNELSHLFPGLLSSAGGERSQKQPRRSELHLQRALQTTTLFSFVVLLHGANELLQLSRLSFWMS